MKDLCNSDCNNCRLLFAKDDNDFKALKQLHVLLNALEIAFGGGVVQIANMVCPNLTCCPNCHIDDFSHFRNCDVEKTAKEVVKEWKKRNAES